MTRAARSSQWGMEKGRARISRKGRGAGATARAGVCPVGEAVRCTRRVEGVAALATVAHRLLRLSGSRRKRRANNTDQVRSDKAAQKMAGTLIRTIAPLIKSDQVPGIGPAYRAGASLLSLSDKASILLLFFEQLTERLVEAQSAVAQGSPRHPAPCPCQYSLECIQKLQKSARYCFCTAIKTHALCPMRNTEHIFLKLMSRSIFPCKEGFLLVCLTPLVVWLNVGQGERHYCVRYAFSHSTEIDRTDLQS